MVFSRRIVKEFAEMERQLGRMLRNTSLTRMVQLQSESDWVPAVDVYETDNEVYVYVDSAGVDMSNMSVSVERTRVTVTGERHWPVRENLRRIHQLEIERGYFKRSVTFPVPVDVASTSSGCLNGILEIRISKENSEI